MCHMGTIREGVSPEKGVALAEPVASGLGAIDAPTMAEGTAAIAAGYWLSSRIGWCHGLVLFESSAHFIQKIQ